MKSASLETRRLTAILGPGLTAKPSGSGGGGSSSGGGGGGGGGSDCEKKYIGCLGYTSSQLSSAWIFPGSPPSCQYVHHAGYNAYYSGLYAGGYFNGGYSSEGSDGGDSTWAGSSYSGGNGYFSGESQGDAGGDENAAGSSSTYWGGSSYSGGSSGYFSGNGESSTETSDNGGSAAGSNEWAGSSYSGASGYFNGDGTGSGGSDQYGDAYGGYSSGPSGQANYGNQAAGYSDGANNYQNVDYQDDYDYSQVQQYSAEDADVVLSNEDFENVNDEEVDEQSNGNASEGQTDGNGQSNGQNNNQEKSQNADQGNGNDSDDASPSYQDQYDPYTDFSIHNCDTYENLWMWDMALTCESEDSLENCKCAFTEELMSLGLLTCEQIALCPSGCQICTTCLTLVGCSASSSASSATSSVFASSGYVYVLGATTGVVLFAVSCFLCSRGWKGGNRNDLGAHLMSKLPDCPHTRAEEASAIAEDKEHPPFVWLAPEVPTGVSVDPIRLVNADASSVDDNSTLYSYPPGDEHEQEASVALASVDDTFKQTPWTSEGVDDGDAGDDDDAGETEGGGQGTGAGDTEVEAPVSDHVWLAPVN